MFPFIVHVYGGIRLNTIMHFKMENIDKYTFCCSIFSFLKNVILFSINQSKYTWHDEVRISMVAPIFLLWIHFSTNIFNSSVSTKSHI